MLHDYLFTQAPRKLFLIGLINYSHEFEDISAPLDGIVFVCHPIQGRLRDWTLFNFFI